MIPRYFEAVEDLPFGKQLQVDFGEEWMKSIDGSKVKVLFVAFALANSIYKYTQFQNKAFTTVDLVNACNNCFGFFGGVPLESVFDQDSIVSVSENYGDVIHTYEFKKLRQQLGFSVYLCCSPSKLYILNGKSRQLSNMLKTIFYPAVYFIGLLA